MVNIKKRFIAGLATLAMTVALASGVTQNTILGDITNSSSIMVAEAATSTVYGNSGVAAIKTYNGATTLNNSKVNKDNIKKTNVSKNDSNPNIILVGDSRTCQLLNLDDKSGKKRLSGCGVWGQNYNAYNNNNSIANVPVKTYINAALNNNRSCHIWIFGTINETYNDPSATNFIAYVRNLRDYCYNKNPNKKVTIHVVHTVGGTADWATSNASLKSVRLTTNKNVSTYNIKIDNTFGNGKENKTITYEQPVYSMIYKNGTATQVKVGTKKITIPIVEIVTADYSNIVTKYGNGYAYTNTTNAKYRGLDSGLHYSTPTLEEMGDWIINKSK